MGDTDENFYYFILDPYKQESVVSVLSVRGFVKMWQNEMRP